MPPVKPNTGETTEPDPNVVADNSLAAQSSAPVDYKLAAQDSHVESVLDALDDLIERVGKDIAAGIQHENRSVRVGAANLKSVLDGLQTARAAVEAALGGGAGIVTVVSSEPVVRETSTTTTTDPVVRGRRP